MYVSSVGIVIGSWAAFVQTCSYDLCHISFFYVEKLCNPGLLIFCSLVLLLILLTCIIWGLSLISSFQVLKICIGSSSSTSRIYGGQMEWGSNLCTMLLLPLMSKDMVSLIHGTITLDSAKLKAILMVQQVEGIMVSSTPSML